MLKQKKYGLFLGRKKSPKTGMIKFKDPPPQDESSHGMAMALI
jgi:hypothetical protein